MRIWEYTYYSPWMFLLLAIIPILIYFHFWRKPKKEASLSHSDLSSFESSDGFNFNSLLVHIPFILNILAVVFVVFALARPQLKLDDTPENNESVEGIDLVISMDISGSMLAMDFKPNRLEAAKEIASQFIDKRPTDRIGLVVYEAESYTACALTTDHESLQQRFKNIKSGELQSGTAIGMGIATAINRLRESKAKSKVIILLTDGVNTDGKIHPLTAAEYAKELGIIIYTIGIGNDGRVRMPGGGFFGNYTNSRLDEKLLQEIADKSSGKFYRARNNNQLERIYNEIDKLEKSKIKTIQYKRDLPEAFQGFIVVSIVLLILAFLLKHLVLKINE
ncbi:MAG: VWA domain-containing protein [Flavobacteriales bacterium]